jgi:hypothetical protein
MRYKPWFIRLANCEYWPVWIYYVPVWIQHFWLALRVRNLFFFLRTNPAIEGFILSDSKSKTLQLVPEAHRPRTVLLPQGASTEKGVAAVAASGMTFPVILKPDIGFRGIKVHVVEHREQLEQLLSNQGLPLMLQEYCAGPLEIGIFYYRYPNEDKGCIPSITIKENLVVTGNGRSTLEELIILNPRAILQKARLKKKFQHKWHQVPGNGEQITLETIGNHNRGTLFKNGNHLMDQALLDIFDKLNYQMKGFYFGRFDIRTSSWEALKDRHEFKILEVNGVGGEPTHIYDPETSLIKAWRDLCFTWRVASRIAQINISDGMSKPTYLEARSLWRKYVSYKSDLLG